MVIFLKLEEDYIGSVSANIDWVAGGNFDGYLFRRILRFSKDNTVKMRTVILDKSRYDADITDTEVIGRYEESDHYTITCYLGARKMRGIILGSKSEYLTFSVYHSENNSFQIPNECYVLHSFAPDINAP
jgi:hypothetical protein